MRDRDELLAIAEGGVKTAAAMGADAAEVYVVQRRMTRVAAAGRYLSPSESLEDSVGIRIIADGRVGISGASSASGIEQAVRHALDSIRDLGIRGTATSFPAPGADPLPRVDVDPRLLGVRADGLAPLAEDMMARMLERPDVTYAQLSLVSLVKQVAIANSSGLAAWDRMGFERVEAELRATRGAKERSASDALVAPRPLEVSLDPVSFIQDVCDRAERALDPRPLQGSAIDRAIFMNGPASQILGMVSKSFSASSAEQNRTPLAARVGQRVFSEWVTFHDEPRGPAGATRRNVDDEGTVTRTLPLVVDGVLQNLVHDGESARRAGIAPTGHGMRTTASGGVAARPINLAMQPGALSVDALVEDTQRAVMITEPLMGSFTANLVTGDFSVVVPFAFLVENGRIAHALPPLTLGGNAHRVLEQVEAVGDRVATFNAASVPAFRAGGVSCAS